MLAVQIALALVFSLLLIVEPVQGQDLEKPIQMDRREVGALGDIVTELKGKSMGGRMRFGKRAMMPHYLPQRPHYVMEEDDFVY